MEKMARVLLKNGNWKYFYGDKAESEANAYEVEMKQQEIEEQERQKKAEAERKKIKEIKEFRYNQVLDKIDLLNKVVESYVKETGEKLEFVTVNGKLTVQNIKTNSNSPYITYIDPQNWAYCGNSHDNWWNQLCKELRNNI